MPAGDTFADAAEQYLKGNWFEAECGLRELLRRNPRDLEAGLMLATLLRHTGRLREAARQLDALQRLDGWEHWATEIVRERARVKAAREPEAHEPAETLPEGSDAAARREDAAESSNEAVRREDTREDTEASEPWTQRPQGSPGGRADAA
jgi:thioredoxin-like negative regulator of GroEL